MIIAQMAAKKRAPRSAHRAAQQGYSGIKPAVNNKPAIAAVKLASADAGIWLASITHEEKPVNQQSDTPAIIQPANNTHAPDRKHRKGGAPHRLASITARRPNNLLQDGHAKELCERMARK